MDSYKVLIDSAHPDCIPNLIDCARFYRYLIKNGHQIVKTPTDADYIIINSCGFSKQLQDKTISLFQKYNNIKKKNSKIIMYGCLIKINPDKLNKLKLIQIDLDDYTKIDKIFLNSTKFNIIKPYCKNETKYKLFKNKQELTHWYKTPFLLTKIFMPFSKKLRKNYNNLIKTVTYNNCNFVEISKGCTGNCSYCIIKKAKGKIISRPTNDIISNIKEINDSTKPIFLVADDCASYGIDINLNFIDLSDKINEELPDIKLDLNYLNPSNLETHYNHYFKLFNSGKVNLVIFPIQSGSQKIVNKMNRKYDINQLIEKIKKIKNIAPKTIFYAHFIIGFPDENIIDFIKTLSVTKNFDYPVAFIYSNVKGTKSYSMSNQKSKYVKYLRLLIFITFVNFVVFYRLNHYPKTIKKQKSHGEIKNE